MIKNYNHFILFYILLSTIYIKVWSYTLKTQWVSTLPHRLSKNVNLFKFSSILRFSSPNIPIKEASSDNPSAFLVTYDDSNSFTRIFVNGLTSVANTFTSNHVNNSKDIQDTLIKASTKLSSSELLEGIQRDFKNGYFWTGKINPNLYADNCAFTDPTISFQGLYQFQKNIASISPFVDRLIKENMVVLYNCTLYESKSQIRAFWRMAGCIDLPWKPRIDIKGSTCYSYRNIENANTNASVNANDAVKNDGRIIDYFESWDTDATTTLLQAIIPNIDKSNKLSSLINTLSKNYSYRSQSISINVEQLKQSILSLANSVKQSNKQIEVKDKMNEYINDLGNITEDIWSTNYDLIPINGSIWKLIYTTAKGGSNGKIGPIYGDVYQKFLTNGSYVNEVVIGPLKLALHAIAKPSKSLYTLNVEFRTLDISLFDRLIVTKPSNGRGYWIMRYIDENMRILDTNLGSIFLLCKI